MERLTEKHYLAEDHYMKCSEACSVDMDCVDCPAFDKLIERLAAYEDTGLTPEEVTAVKLALMGKTLAEITEFEGVPLARLRELAEADKAGRCVVLPCKVGEKIYYLNGKYIIEVEVVGYKVDETGAWLFIGETYIPETNRAYHCDLETERIGKTVFFTSEDAKKTMEGMENGNKTSL